MNHSIEPDSYSNEAALAEAMGRFRVKAEENTTGNVEKFTQNHRVWDVSLYMDGELIYRTDYQSADFPKGGDVWNCVARDATDYADNSDLADFLEEFGYIGDAKSVRQGIAAFEGCKRTSEALREKGIDPIALAGLFSDAENADVLDAVAIEIAE